MNYRRILLLAIIYAFFFGGLLTFKGEMLLLAVPFIIYVGLGLIDSPVEPGLEFQREIDPERVQPGMPVNVSLKVRNTGSRHCILSLDDRTGDGLELISGEARLLTRLAAGQSTELNYTIQGRRGIYALNHLSVTSLGSDVLFEANKTIALPGQIFILPQVPQIRRLNMRAWQTKVYAGNISSRVPGSGTDFFGVRSYQTGDSLRRINWRVSARYLDFLYSNEYERERVTEIWLILDGRKRSNLSSERGDLFEQIVLAGSGLAQALIKEGNRVGLLVFGGYLRWTFPGYGKVQRERILRALARAHPGDLFIFSDLENLPARAFPLSSQLIFVSPLHREDIPILLKLKNQGYSILVISPDPVRFQYNQLSKADGGLVGLKVAGIERQHLLKRLQNAGMGVIDWDVTIPFERIIQAPMRHPAVSFHPVRPL